MLRHEDARLGVHQGAAVEHDAAAIGPHQPCDQVDGGRLARPRPAEQSGNAFVVLEFDIEIECAELQSCVHGSCKTGHASLLSLHSGRI